jgi:hypothetical protein
VTLAFQPLSEHTSPIKIQPLKKEMFKLAAFFALFAAGNMVSALPNSNAEMMAQAIVDHYSPAG